MVQIENQIRFCEENLNAADVKTSSDACNTILDYIDTVSGGVFEYDARIFDYDWDPQGALLSDFLNNCG